MPTRSDRAAPKFTATGVAPMAGPNLQVVGGGTLGRLTKWTGFTSSNSFIGDSTIFESKTGLVGIGTDAPTSKLTVQGMIETTLGGVKFPDGSIQTTAAVAGLPSVFHDPSLTGDGTSGSPLGVAVPLNLSGPSPVVTIHGSAGGFAAMSVTGADNQSFGGDGLEVSAGNGDDQGGTGLHVIGGQGAAGGIGLVAVGGLGGVEGGVGLMAVAGNGASAAIFEGGVNLIGDLLVTGNLSKGGGSFKIDHPLDPENKYLYHSFVESPDMMNIYNGVAKLDEYGEAVVEMPDWFSSLNRDFRYLLTPMGAPAPGLYIAEELANNRFKIAGGVPGMKVSWQVTGIRQDAFANKHRIPVEEMKPERERGYYLHPDAYDQPKERRIERARNPEQMRQLKDSREQLKRKNKDR